MTNADNLDTKSEGNDGPNDAAIGAASSLLLHEAKFRRIRGYKQMHLLLAAMDNVDSKQAVA